ncbi:hypothetical protein RND81_11G209300 [Saponaria officinalis]|uniref:Netrin receptor DCC n=1 Tax=Saponaria officinalis TaxID=3572 RepID=A0AAW1HQ73_SAPOF
MPTLSAIQLDRFLEPGATTATTATTTSINSDKLKLERRNTTSFQLDDRKSPSSRSSGDIPPPYPHLRRRNSISIAPRVRNGDKLTVRPQMTPALYTTPESTPLPMSPTSSFPPSSPFLINHKRRGPRLAKSVSDQNVAAVAPTSSGDEVAAELVRTRSLFAENVSLERNGNEFDEVVNTVDVDVDVDVDAVVDVNVGENRGMVDVSESEDFFDPQESMSYSSSVNGEDYSCERSVKANTPSGEFYDAWEELSSDSGRQAAQRSLSDVETELREMRLTLIMEIEKRKQVEEAVHSMQSRWQMLRERLGAAGLVLPANLAVSEDSQSDVSPSEDICRQIHLARFVSESIGRGIARAEVEADMEAQLEVKNFEIARLCDRLHYYETMNREMSQRNQEAVEIARHDRHKRRRRQKWIWVSIATAITLGSAALAWSYLPGGTGSSSTKSLEASEPNSDTQ